MNTAKHEAMKATVKQAIDKDPLEGGGPGSDLPHEIRDLIDQLADILYRTRSLRGAPKKVFEAKLALQKAKEALNLSARIIDDLS